MNSHCGDIVYVHMYMCVYVQYMHTRALGYIPYSGKFLQDKIFADGSENKHSWIIKFSRMVAYHAE